MRHYIKALRDEIPFPDLNCANVLDVTSVVEFYFAEFEREYWDIHTDFPSFLPSYPSMPDSRQFLMYMETAAPSHINSEKFGKMRWNGPDRWGVITSVTSVTNAVKRGLWKQFAGTLLPGIDDVWIVAYTAVGSLSPSIPCQLLGQIIFSVDANGVLSRDKETGTTGVYMPVDDHSRAERELHANNILTLIKPFIFAAHISSQPDVKYKTISLSSGLRKQLELYNTVAKEYIYLEKDDFRKYLREEPYERLSTFVDFPTDAFFKSVYKTR